MTKGIHFIITGGTIDSHYKGSIDTVVPHEKSIIPDYIKHLKLYETFKFTELCMKDSRDLTKKDQNKIIKEINNSKHKKIIITHGTYTMPETAIYLESKLNEIDKVIIITGAMIPLQGFSPSDAAFNLGFTIAKIQELKKGIYVCMNGKLFDAHELHIPTKKMEFIKEGRFTSKANQ